MRLTKDELSITLLTGQPVPVLDPSYKGITLDLHLDLEEQLAGCQVKTVRGQVRWIDGADRGPLYLCLDGRARSVSEINHLRDRIGVKDHLAIL